MSWSVRGLTLLVAAPLLTAGCGPSRATPAGPVSGLRGHQSQVAQRLGFPAFATKNTTRVGGADPTADAAGVAQAVYPAVSTVSRPQIVALVDSTNVSAALAAAVLMSSPLRAPFLLSDGSSLPPASAEALRALAPTGSPDAGGAQVIRVGHTAPTPGLRAASIVGDDLFAQARAIDTFMTRVRGHASERVMVVSADDPAYAMPAAAWAAKSGDPILFVNRSGVPAQTRAALAAHQQPKIYVIGPGTVIPSSVVDTLRTLGSVRRVRGPDPVSNSIAFARYLNGAFGWGVVDPGHGLVFANQERPLDALAAAPLSATGTYGPLIVLDRPGAIPPLLTDYLLDIQPGYHIDPVRGVYNHGWLIGDQTAISVATQAILDAELEIVPVSGKTRRATPPSGPQRAAPSGGGPTGAGGPTATTGPTGSTGAGARGGAGAGGARR